MNATAAALCTKPALGVAMYFMSLCASNQALHDVFVDLGRVGTVASVKVDAPMDEAYSLILWRVAAQPNGRYDHAVDFACGRAAALSLTLTVSHEGESQAESHAFEARCPPRRDADPTLVPLGQWRLKKGVSTLEIVNNVPIDLPPDGRVQVLLVGVGAPPP